jgi:hypothetical protein
LHYYVHFLLISRGAIGVNFFLHYLKFQNFILIYPTVKYWLSLKCPLFFCFCFNTISVHQKVLSSQM